MEKQPTKNQAKKENVKREYNKALVNVTRLQTQLDRAEYKAQQYAHQLFAAQ